jgi:hypothetical protein
VFQRSHDTHAHHDEYLATRRPLIAAYNAFASQLGPSARWTVIDPDHVWFIEDESNARAWDRTGVFRPQCRRVSLEAHDNPQIKRCDGKAKCEQSLQRCLLDALTPR